MNGPGSATGLPLPSSLRIHTPHAANPGWLILILSADLCGSGGLRQLPFPIAKDRSSLLKHVPYCCVTFSGLILLCPAFGIPSLSTFAPAIRLCLLVRDTGQVMRFQSCEAAPCSHPAQRQPTEDEHHGFDEGFLPLLICFILLTIFHSRAPTTLGPY